MRTGSGRGVDKLYLVLGDLLESADDRHGSFWSWGACQSNYAGASPTRRLRSGDELHAFPALALGTSSQPNVS